MLAAPELIASPKQANYFFVVVVHYKERSFISCPKTKIVIFITKLSVYVYGTFKVLLN